LLDATLMRSETKRKEKNDSRKTETVSFNIDSGYWQEVYYFILKKKPLNFLKTLKRDADKLLLKDQVKKIWKEERDEPFLWNNIRVS
jgi:hypothetical protein